VGTAVILHRFAVKVGIAISQDTVAVVLDIAIMEDMIATMVDTVINSQAIVEECLALQLLQLLAATNTLVIVELAVAK